VTFFVDGKPAGSQTVQYAASALPLRVGNWLLGERPFNGRIMELSIGKPRGEAAINATAAKAAALKKR
jgi:hypothetical protein